MTEEEYIEFGIYAVGLWPEWKPTDEQREAWRSALMHRKLGDCKAALQAGFKISQWREPKLPDVLAALPKSQGMAKLPPEDEEKLLASHLADMELKRKHYGLGAPKPRRTPDERVVLAKQLLDAASLCRREVARLQSDLDASINAVQPALDELRARTRIVEQQVKELAVEVRADTVALVEG